MLCKKCITPDSRPDVNFVEGVCDACISAEKKEIVDWKAREQELQKLLNKYKRKDGYYDCIIPVSGGKDSHWQVKKVLEYGLKPLCITFAPCGSTQEGKDNLNNIAKLGVDHLIFRMNRKTYKEIFTKAFQKLGDPCWPCHAGIFTYPLRVAINYKIPLIIWGENPHTEYGGPARDNNILSSTWLAKYGGLNDMMVNDWVKEGINWSDMLPFIYPSDKELQDIGVTGIYLGYYLNWDAKKQVKEVEKLGFKRRKKIPANAILDYENVDCAFVDMHDHLAWLKFGCGRTTTQASIDIRNGRMLRITALALAKMKDYRLPDIKKFSKFTGLSIKKIRETLNKFKKEDK